jgi:hypothetical protein
LFLTPVYAERAFWLSGGSLARHSARGKRSSPVVRGGGPQDRRDGGGVGARRVWRQIRLLLTISTQALMKALHQKKRSVKCMKNKIKNAKGNFFLGDLLL